MKKTILHESECGSVEMFALTHKGRTDTWLRKGHKTEEVSGEVDLTFTPNPATCSNVTKSEHRLWSTKGGLNEFKTPKSR